MKKKGFIFVLLVSLFLGILIALQFKTVQHDYLGGMIPTTRLDKLKEELDLLKGEKTKLQETISDLQKRLEELASDDASDNTTIKALSEELQKYKTFSGFTNLQGTGVVVYIDNASEDSEQKTDIVSDYGLILHVINELTAAGAEAISINGQRYTSNSEIRGTGEYISVNSVGLKPPFIIKAIGDKRVLSTAVEQRFGMINVIRKRGYLCEVNIVEDLRIDRSNEIIEFKYAKPIE